MKYVFIENIRLSSALKPCVGCCAWPAAAGMRRIRRLQLSPRQQFRRQCDKAVSQAFHQAKQRYGAPRITDELREQG